MALVVVLVLLLTSVFIGLGVKWALMLVGVGAWAYYIVLPLLAVLCYGSSCILSGYFIRARAPEMWSEEEVFIGVRKWELTAGMGIVPKWVSLIGLMPIPCLLALFLPLVIALLR